MPSRRATLLLLATPALAQPRATRLIIPYPPGGPGDQIGRLLVPHAEGTLVIDNRPGGNATIGLAAVAQAAPDGLTIGLGASQTHAINPAMMASMPFRPIEDFTPLAGLVALPHALVVPAASPVRDVAGLLAMLRREPGRYSHGSTGNGSGGHLGGAMLARAAAVESIHVPFRGSAPLATELVAGRIDYAIITLASALAPVAAGQFRALAIVSASRAAAWPDIPTMAELGMPDVSFDAWFALFAPAGLPAPLVARFEALAARAMDDGPAVRRLEEAGFIPWRRSAAELAALLPVEIARWAAVVAAAGARIE